MKRVFLDHHYKGILPGSYSNFLLQNIPAAVYTCNHLGIITFYNNMAAEIWGREPVSHNAWSGSYKTYDSNGYILSAEQTIAALTTKEKKGLTGSYTIEQPNGTRIEVTINTQPVHSALGDITEVMCVMQPKKELTLLADTETLENKVKEYSTSLKESQERYHKMIDEVQDYAILLLDTDGFILNWNKGAESIKGYKEEEIVGKNFRVFYQESDKKDKLPERLINLAYEQGRATHEGWRLRKDGTAFWGSIVITALHDDNNNIIGFTKVTRDLTERKLTEDKITDYAREIELQNKQLEEYAYIASHDLQEPLRKIRIFSEMLKKDVQGNPMAERNIEKINASAQRMTNLIKDVLKYSQLTEVNELFTTVDLNEVYNYVLEDLDLLIEQKNAKIESNTLPQIEGIPIQLQQLIGNLISNAIKFCDKNPLITIKSAPLTAEDIDWLPQSLNTENYTKLTFTDNGPGFEQEYAEQVFKMFKRLSENSGTGIGLALCKKITENHKGFINVYSKPGEGTSFNVFLPFRQ